MPAEVVGIGWFFTAGFDLKAGGRILGTESIHQRKGFLLKRCLVYICILSLVVVGCSSVTGPPQPATLTSVPQTEMVPSLTATIASVSVGTALPRGVPSPVTRSSSATVPCPTSSLTPSPVVPPTPTIAPELSPTVRVDPTFTPTPSATPSPSPTPTPDPFAGLTIADLKKRDYGGGELKVEETLGAYAAFTRLLISYPSDGLTIYGFMNVPTGEGPFPVLIVLHGYVNPARYQTLAYTTRYADALARAGYLVMHPNLRGYAPSDDGPNRFRVGMAVDTLNLIALVKEWGGREGILEQADPGAIGLMGHSMGGGIAIRVLTVDPSVDAAVLYGSMNADERANYERVLLWTDGQRGQEELDVPEEDLRRISPVHYLDGISAAVGIHHGGKDEEVPLEWSEDLVERLRKLEKSVEYYEYPGAPHTFWGESDQLFIERMIAFFDQHLKGE